MERAGLKRLLRFPLTFRQNLVVLVTSLAGIILLMGLSAFRHGASVTFGVAIAALAALSAAAGTLMYYERRSRTLLGELRATLSKIAPSYPALVQITTPPQCTLALEKEIRSLAENWRDFCDHYQSAPDTEGLQAEHLAAMGELAAGLVHEIRNPLAGIAGAIEIITKDFPKDHPDREILHDIREETRRIEKVLNDLLAYARPKPPQFEVADLPEIVARTLQLASQQVGEKNVEFSTQLPPHLPRFRMDPEQLHQVLLSLALNGIEALGREGRITIAARVQPGSGMPNDHDSIEIVVADSGGGLSREQLEKIFRPFYTTRKNGAGLGLPLSRRIISQQGGTLKAESELKKGSRFIIRLPMRNALVEAPALKS